MGINFENIPANLLNPFFGVEFTSSGSNLPSASNILLIGQKLTTGSAPDRSITAVGAKEENALFGRGSMAARMVKAFRLNNPTLTPYVYALSDPSGTKASSVVSVVTAPNVLVTETLQIKVAGRMIYVPIIAGQTATSARTLIVQAINNDLDNACEAAISSGADGTISHKHRGTIGNDIIVEKIGSPALNFTVSNLTGGTGDIILTGREGDFPENLPFKIYANPYSDSTNLDFNKSLLSNNNGKWSFNQRNYGHAVTLRSDTFVNLTSSTLKNDEHTTVFAIPKATSHTPLSEIVAAVSAVLHFHLDSPPSISNSLVGRKVLGVDLKRFYDFTDREQLYKTGYSPLKIDRDGNAEFDRVITTYLRDDAGSEDATFRDINIMFQLIYAAQYYRNKMQSQFSNTFITRETLERVGVVASDILRDLENLNVFENVEKTIKEMIIERDSLSTTRINTNFTPYHVNPLSQMATKISSSISA